MSTTTVSICCSACADWILRRDGKARSSARRRNRALHLLPVFRIRILAARGGSAIYELIFGGKPVASADREHPVQALIAGSESP